MAASPALRRVLHEQFDRGGKNHSLCYLLARIRSALFSGYMTGQFTASLQIEFDLFHLISFLSLADIQMCTFMIYFDSQILSNS